jgi:DNA mismatch repair protein MutL
LFLEVNPASIDINIHPTKTEIKFDDEHTLYAILRSSVKHSLGQFSVAPVLDFEHDANLDTPYSYKNKEADIPTVQVDHSFNPFEEDNKKSFSSNFKKDKVTNWESLYVGLESKSNFESDFSSLEFESEQVTGDLFDHEEKESNGTVTYQLHKKYIVTTIKSGLIIINQHRAHQRVLYEQFLKDITVKQAVSQQLLFPLNLNFNKTEIQLLDELKSSLENTGFVFSKFEDDIIEITGLPMNVTESEASILLDQLLSDFQQEVPDSGFSQADLLAKTLCFSLAVKTGEIMNVNSLEALVNNLFACKESTVSPFNKQTYTTITVNEIDNKFL